MKRTTRKRRRRVPSSWDYPCHLEEADRERRAAALKDDAMSICLSPSSDRTLARTPEGTPEELVALSCPFPRAFLVGRSRDIPGTPAFSLREVTLRFAPTEGPSQGSPLRGLVPALELFVGGRSALLLTLATGLLACSHSDQPSLSPADRAPCPRVLCFMV